MLSDLPFSEGQEVEVVVVAKDGTDTLVEAFKNVLELHPDDKRALSELRAMLLQRLDDKLKESGLLKEVRGPITDFTPYKDRTLMPYKGKPLSEIVIENRR